MVILIIVLILVWYPALLLTFLIDGEDIQSKKEFKELMIPYWVTIKGGIEEYRNFRKWWRELK